MILNQISLPWKKILAMRFGYKMVTFIGKNSRNRKKIKNKNKKKLRPKIKKSQNAKYSKINRNKNKLNLSMS